MHRSENLDPRRSAVSIEQAVNAIDREELADLAVELGAIESPAGAEGPAAERVDEWLRAEGFAVKRLALVPERPNIVGRWMGGGGGRTLVFNAHLDTAISRHDTLVYSDPAQRRHISAWREGDTLFGNGLVNDKAPMAAFMVAMATLKRQGIRLAGDVVLTAVPGEIGLEPVDEYEGVAYLGKDLGTRFAVAHGAIGDAALVAEATGNTLAWVMAGKAYFRITVRGGEPLYTPFVPMEADPKKNPNAIIRLAPVLEALAEWGTQYAERVFDSPGGTIVPKANVGAVRSGSPWKFTKSTEVAFLYLDVRLAPDADVPEIQRELRRMLDTTGIKCDVECILHRRGFEAEGIAPLAGAVREAHIAEHGSEPARPAPPITSMWRDTNPYNEAGIPSLTYGPTSSSGGGNIALPVDELAATARVYARSAINFCGQEET
jgi:acetylornithine deacetylase/succinyl-diaminopimelate desuccinylase-like protein